MILRDARFDNSACCAACEKVRGRRGSSLSDLMRTGSEQSLCLGSSWALQLHGGGTLPFCN